MQLALAWLVVSILLLWVLEFLISIIYKNYTGYTLLKQVYSFPSWFYFTWNYIGGSRHDASQIVRRVGVRWLGFEWEREYSVPRGELRF